MTMKFGIFAIVLVLLVSAAAAQGFITPYSGFEEWLPVVFIGIVLGFLIVSVHYILGTALQNKKVTSSAVGELAQVIGAAVVAVIVIGILYFVGTSEFSFVSLISPSSVSLLCTQFSSSSVNFLSGAPTNTICDSASSVLSGTGGITDSLDYGLFSSYAIVANITNQAANNLNSMYIFEGWIGFLSKFTSITEICEPAQDCWLPYAPRAFGLNISYSPLAGYASLSTVTAPLEAEASLTFYLLFMQMFVILMLLYAWPYLLAAGLIMKATFFTRRLGGLLMAMALSAVLILPLMYVLEYTAFSNLSLGPIGATNLPNAPVYESLPNGNVIIYGSNSIAGYVPSYLVPSASCLSYTVVGTSVEQSREPSYVYESDCGNPDTASTSCAYITYSNPSVTPLCPQVTASALPTTQTCASGETGCTFSGYVPYSQAPNAGCTSSEYAYETTCGNAATATGRCSATPSNTMLCTSPLSSNVNFFVLPNIGDALSYYSCLPNNLLASEVAFSLYYLVPGFGLVTGIISGATGFFAQLPITPLNIAGVGSCVPAKAIQSVLMLANVYGIIFVDGVLLPLLNILIALSAVSGFAVLFGGDTDILGLSRLI